MHNSTENHRPRLCRRRWGAVEGITRDKKRKKQTLTQSRPRGTGKRGIKLTLVNFEPLNYRC
ncbi:hypothetical protein DV606_04210 [Salmonella enterica]|nr:hypothetical protein [Salmonella enterica]